MISKVLVVLVLGPLLIYNIAETCGRVPATPKPTDPPVSTPPIATINDSVRSLPCTVNETRTTGCLNGGTCFVLVLERGHRETSCLCTAEYRGKWCEELNIDIIIPTLDDGSVATAGIAASLAVLTVIIIVFTGVAIVYFKRRREERRRNVLNTLKMKSLENGKLPENHTLLSSSENEDEDLLSSSAVEETDPPRPMLNRPTNSNRNSFCGNGNSNRNSGFFIQNGNTNAGDGNANTEYGYLEINNYNDFEYIDEGADVDEKTPMTFSDNSIDKKILMTTKTTSV